MKKKTKIIIGVSAGVLVIAGLGFYIYSKNNKNKSSSNEKSTDTGSYSDNFEVGMGSDSGAVVDERYTTPINPKLSNLRNEDVASYLSQILNEEEIDSLRGWIRLIKKERAKDPSKWGDASGLSGETSIIGHALYQMDESGNCNDCWNSVHQTALIDAQ